MSSDGRTGVKNCWTFAGKGRSGAGERWRSAPTGCCVTPGKMAMHGPSRPPWRRSARKSWSRSYRRSRGATRPTIVPGRSACARWLYSTGHIAVHYSVDYDGLDIRKLSPGTRGIVLLLLYLALDDADDRPLIIDQPEENLDPKSIFDELVGLFLAAKRKRQVIIVTHNANLVVNTDADQIIIASAGPNLTGQLPPITYYVRRPGERAHPDIRLRHSGRRREGVQRARTSPAGELGASLARRRRKPVSLSQSGLGPLAEGVELRSAGFRVPAFRGPRSTGPQSGRSGPFTGGSSDTSDQPSSINASGGSVAVQLGRSVGLRRRGHHDPAAAGVMAPIGNHTFRATGITAYLGTAACLSTRGQWPRMKACARPSSMTGTGSDRPGRGRKN